MESRVKAFSILCAVALLGLGGLLFIEHGRRLRLSEENNTLRRQFAQMSSVAAENERLAKEVAEAKVRQSLSEEGARPQHLTPDEHHQLLRLRGEVGVLRRQSNDVQTLLNENRQLRTTLDEALAARRLSAGPGPARPVPTQPSRLEIVKAEYWTEKARMDVGAELMERIIGDKLEASAGNHIKGDPEFGKVKKLTVEYRFDGVNMTNQFTEGENMVLPPEPK
jgi:hypothetical protein